LLDDKPDVEMQAFDPSFRRLAEPVIEDRFSC